MSFVRSLSQVPLLRSVLKPVNAAQARALVELAKHKKLFLLEAVWTRFFPLSFQIRDLITSGKLGHVSMVFADFSDLLDKQKLGMKHRAYNRDLAGGSLLDTGLYSITWVMQTIYHAQKGRREAPQVSGSLILVPETGVDDTAIVVLTWKDCMF
jgi:dihydrodiol dehydrogenase / D-xylose 1-dehydrogenase (NADP)